MWVILLKKTKLTELENLIPAALTTVENKILSVSDLVKKKTKNKLNDHNYDKYIATSEFNKLAGDVFNAKLAQANLITKTDFDTKLFSLNRKITQNKIKHLLVESELNKSKTYLSKLGASSSHIMILH